MQDTYIKSDIKLTIGILISDRKKYIRDALEALKPLLSAIPSELILVDTKGGAGNESIEIAREYTDKIYPFAWCNDFAAARNVCLKHASGEWFLFQDDDEVFDDVQELIEFFRSGECNQYGSGFYYAKNYSADGGYKMSVLGRMVRRTPDIRFVGTVHEHFNRVPLPHKVFSCFVHHYGYVFATEEEKKEHQRRNVTLLQKDLKEQGITPRICAQMVQELLLCKDTQDAGYEFGLKGLAELEKKKQLQDACTQWTMVALVRYFKVKQDYQGLMEQARSIRENYKLSQMAQLALAGVVIETSAPEGNVRAILEYAPLYKEAWDWLNNHEKEAVTQNQMDFSNYRDREYAIQVFQAAATCANAVGRFEEAMEYWSYLPWEDKEFDASPYEAEKQKTEQGLKEVFAYREGIKEVQNLMDVWKEAASVVRSLLETNRASQAIELLSGMQEVVIALGNRLEQLLGEERSADVIRLLEQCCEEIWQCANGEHLQEMLNTYSGVERIMYQMEEYCLELSKIL